MAFNNIKYQVTISKNHPSLEKRRNFVYFFKIWPPSTFSCTLGTGTSKLLLLLFKFIFLF